MRTDCDLKKLTKLFGIFTFKILKECYPHWLISNCLTDWPCPQNSFFSFRLKYSILNVNSFKSLWLVSHGHPDHFQHCQPEGKIKGVEKDPPNCSTSIQVRLVGLHLFVSLPLKCPWIFLGSSRFTVSNHVRTMTSLPRTSRKTPWSPNARSQPPCLKFLARCYGQKILGKWARQWRSPWPRSKPTWCRNNLDNSATNNVLDQWHMDHWLQRGVMLTITNSFSCVWRAKICKTSRAKDGWRFCRWVWPRVTCWWPLTHAIYLKLAPLRRARTKTESRAIAKPPCTAHAAHPLNRRKTRKFIPTATPPAAAANHIAHGSFSTPTDIIKS